MSWIFLFLLSFTLFAHEDHLNCEHDPDKDFLDKLYGWFSSNESEVANAPCKTKKIPDDEAMKKFIASREGEQVDSSVNGIEFKNESSALIAAFKDLTTMKSYFGDKPDPQNQLKIQEKFNINPGCDKVMCAMEKIWGKETALKMLYVKLKTNFNTSELAFMNSSRFTRDELDDVVMALEDLPGHLHPLGLNNNQRLTPFTIGQTLPQYGEAKVNANAVIMLFEHWSAKPQLTRQYIIFHELAHNISSRLNRLDESPEWLNLSGWITMDDEWEATSPSKCFISDYAKAYPWEDFAETVSAYRYNGAQLKTKCPQKYDFIKAKVFKGIEYLTPATCAATPR